MGMDLYGLNPASERGEHFRANVWQWKPLWEYTCGVAASVLTKDDCRVGQYNFSPDRHEIPAPQTRAVAAILRQMIETGEAKQYQEAYRPETDTTPAKLLAKLRESGPHSFNVNLVQEFAEFCEHSGGFMTG